jgi:hypothetical protein
MPLWRILAKNSALRRTRKKRSDTTSALSEFFAKISSALMFGIKRRPPNRPSIEVYSKIELPGYTETSVRVVGALHEA